MANISAVGGASVETDIENHLEQYIHHREAEWRSGGAGGRGYRTRLPLPLCGIVVVFFHMWDISWFGWVVESSWRWY